MRKEACAVNPPERLLKRPEHVTIIGAGIGGLVTAYELLKEGVQVTLVSERDPLDAQNTPACGGCGGLIQPKTIKLLNELGLFEKDNPPEQIIRSHPQGFQVFFPDGVVLNLPSKEKMWAVYRGFGPSMSDEKKIGFDGWLFKQVKNAGSEDTFTFIKGKVTEVELGAEKKAKIKLSNAQIIETDFVVDATGAKASLDKPKNAGITYTYPHGVVPMDEPEVRRSLTAEFTIDKPESESDNFIKYLIKNQKFGLRQLSPKVNISLWF